MCIIYIGFLTQLTLPGLDGFSKKSIITIVASLVFFDGYIIELLYVLLFGIWLINGKAYFRIFCYILSFIFIVIYVIQLTVYYQSGEFLPRLAIENINHISLLLRNTSLIIAVILFLIIFCCLLFVLERICRDGKSLKSLFIISSIIFLLLVLLQQSKAWLPQSVIEQRNMYYTMNNLTPMPPAESIYKIIFDQREVIIIPSSQSKVDLKLDLKKQYPLIKDFIYKGRVPFEKITDNPIKPNIIVFFIEGFSARTINYYGCSKYPGLTPSIDDFARHSMGVFNYFNHTAATYRGIHGQLCSIYPKYGGEGGWHTNYKDMPATNYLSLNHILDKYGYETIFLDCHRKDKAYIDEMLFHLGFDQVWNAEELSKHFLKSAEPLRDDALSDIQLFNSLIEFLKNHPEDPSGENPFFIGLYNLGTHAWQKLSKDGKQYNDERNFSINTIHTLDHAFGKFWEYYKNSKYRQNTIIIFTADHCHYQEKEFVKAFGGPDYQRYFVDRIPFIIHDPFRNLPKTFDANYATSIDFTPSLVHYFGLQNQKNPFIGTSIFSGNREGIGIASYGEDYFLIDSIKIHRKNFSEFHKEKLAQVKIMIEITKFLEVEDRIWNPALNN